VIQLGAQISRTQVSRRGYSQKEQGFDPQMLLSDDAKVPIFISGSTRLSREIGMLSGKLNIF
jgi:hypothetical protein